MELPISFFNHDAQAGGFFPKSHVGIDVSSFGHGQNMLLEGIRGTGKTHVLKMVEMSCIKKFEINRVLPIYVSIAQINEHARKDKDEFRLHLYTHIVQQTIETIEKHKLKLKGEKSTLQNAIESIKKLFNINTHKSFDEIINELKSVAENLRFELQFNLTSQSFKDIASHASASTCSIDGKIGFKQVAEVKSGIRESASLSGSVEDNIMYVGKKLAHQNASSFLLEFLKQLQVILNLDHSLLLLDECSDADSKSQIEIFGLFKAIRGSNSLLHDKNCCAHFIGSVYPNGATYYPNRNIDGFSFEPGHDCTVEFLEWDELDSSTYKSFFSNMFTHRLKEFVSFNGKSSDAIKCYFDNYDTFLLAAYCANGIPRRFWEIIKRGYDRNINKIQSTSVKIAIQEVANDQLLAIGHLTGEDIDFINNIVDRLLNKNVEIRRINRIHNINHPQYIYFSINRQNKYILDRLVVQGAVHDKSRMRKKSKFTLKPIYSLDISLSYNFSVIPQKNFANAMVLEIPKCANSSFDQAFDVQRKFLSSIYNNATIAGEQDTKIYKILENENDNPQDAKGTIYSFVPGKFGFIEVDDGGPNAFFYCNQVDAKDKHILKKGDKVSFIMKNSDRGRQGLSIVLNEETDRPTS